MPHLKTGHVARRCPDKDTSKASLVGTEQLAITDRPRAMCIEDADGFTIRTKGRPRPVGAVLGDLPVVRRYASQQERKVNRFAPSSTSEEALTEESCRTQVVSTAPGHKTQIASGPAPQNQHPDKISHADLD